MKKDVLLLQLCTDAKFLDEIQTKVLIHFLLLFTVTATALLLETSFSSNSHNLLQFLLYTTREKGGKPCPMPPSLWGLRNPYKNLNSENSQDYDQKPQRNCTFMNSASGVAPSCTTREFTLF
jgi:hypothetical protein